MPRLQAKGKSDFVALATVPSRMAESEGNVVLSALRTAVDGLLEIVIAEKSDAMEEQSLRTFMLLKSLQQSLEEDLERVKLVLDVIEGKLTSFGGDDGED